MQVLDDQHFRELFGPNSRAEVPIIGRVVIGDELMRVSGQVDRLADTDDAVLIADFKTGRNQPARFAAYVRQLALYRAVLRRLYPDKTVRAAIVWTEAPDLMVNVTSAARASFFNAAKRRSMRVVIDSFFRDKPRRTRDPCRRGPTNSPPSDDPSASSPRSRALWREHARTRVRG